MTAVTRKGLRTAAISGALLLALAAAPLPALSQTLPPTLQGKVDSIVRDRGVYGGLFLVQDANGSHTYRAGERKYLTQTPIGNDDQYRVGSQTKMFVAVALLQLVDEGRIKLDNSINSYAPGLINNRNYDGNRITVRQLLKHTSGLADFSQATNALQKFTPQARLEQALALKPVAAPGVKYSYSNANYVALGLLLERVLGKPVEQIVTERVIQRAGLANTFFPVTGQTGFTGPHSSAYRLVFLGVSADVTNYEPSQIWTAGAIVSTSNDMSKFMRTLFDGNLLSTARLAEMLGDTTAGETYGLGIGTQKVSCSSGPVTVYGHTGLWGAFDTGTLRALDGRSVSWVLNTSRATGASPELVALGNAAIQQAICEAKPR